GHLVWNGQPVGGFSGLGISPFIFTLFSIPLSLGFDIGIDFNKASVYGCMVSSNNLPLSATFTILLNYINAFLSLINFTADNPCPINIKVKSNSFCNSFNKFKICD